jgi:branched-chain amino acid aminotransferase
MLIEDITIDIQKTTNSRLPQIDVNTAPFGKVFSDHMFEMDYADGAWSNPVIRPFKNLTMSPGSMVLHYGQAIFEGMKAYNYKNGEIVLFRPMDNIHRMNISAERMAMPPIPENVFYEGLMKLIELDRGWVPTARDSALYIRPVMFATDDFVGVKESSKYKFIIFTSPANAYYSAPIKVKIEMYYSRACKGGTGFAKAAGNYAASLYPARLAKEAGYDQLIWTDAETHTLIEEAGTMNVMFVINGELITPPSSETILDSITRKSVITLAEQMNIPVKERVITVKEVVEALENGTLTEAFGAGTAATVAPIKTIAYKGKDYDLPDTKHWKIALRLLNRLTDIRLGEYPDENNWIVKLG